MPMVIHPPEQAEFLDWPYAHLLSFDPSMTNTGWSHILFTPGAKPLVTNCGHFGTKPTGIGTSMRDNLVRMGRIDAAVEEVVESAYMELDLGVIELPVPNPSGAASASGSMACTTASNSLVRSGYEVAYVHPNHSKKVVTGNGNASKAEVKQFVARWIANDTWTANQDVSDSVAAALTVVLDAIEGRLKSDEQYIYKALGMNHEH